jgi:hypothetical protein
VEDADLTDQVRRAFQRFHFERSVAEVTGTHNRVRVMRASFAGAVAIAAAVALWLLNASPFVGSASVSLAGWQPIPTTSDQALANDAKATCLADSSLPAMSLVAQDQRGTAATLVYAGGAELALCLVVRDSSGAVVDATSGVSHLDARTGALTFDTGISAPKTPNYPGLRIVAGRVEPTVKGVKVSRADGLKVDATVNSGYFVAWWPTDDDPVNATAIDSSGAVLATVPALK